MTGRERCAPGADMTSAGRATGQRREAALDPSGRWVGAAVPRKEDRRMLLGRAPVHRRLARPGMLHAAFARSPFAAARVGPDRYLRRARSARRRGVFTAADLGSPYLLAVLERDEFVPTRCRCWLATRCASSASRSRS